VVVPTRLILFKANDQVIEVKGLKNNVSGAFLNAATVTATLKDPAGANVTGLTAIPLAYVAASSGDYRGQVEETFNPAQKDGYTLHIDASEGGLVLHVEIRRE
jgi:hypothetical protein